MKVIDLLVKIANGEEVPKKIRFDCAYWNRVCSEKYTYYIDEDNDNDLFVYFFRKNLTFTLTDEVEIIEEDKKIDKLNILDSGWHKFLNEAENYDLELNKKEYEIANKINEIIEVINGRD